MFGLEVCESEGLGVPFPVGLLGALEDDLLAGVGLNGEFGLRVGFVGAVCGGLLGGKGRLAFGELGVRFSNVEEW